MRKFLIILVLISICGCFGGCDKKNKIQVYHDPYVSYSGEKESYNSKYVTVTLPKNWGLPIPQMPIALWTEEGSQQTLYSESGASMIINSKENSTVDARKAVFDFVVNHPELQSTTPEYVNYGKNEFWKTSYNNGTNNVQLFHLQGAVLTNLIISGDNIDSDAGIISLLSDMVFKEAGK